MEQDGFWQYIDFHRSSSMTVGRAIEIHQYLALV